MKPINPDISRLKALRKRMDARPSDWKIGEHDLSEREKLIAELAEGIEINLDEVEVGPGGLLTYKGEQVILYIKDTRHSRWTLENEPEKSKRFHIAECSTLETMREQGRYERYVVTNRTDGKFLVNWHNSDTGSTGEIEAALKVCKNCLHKLNYKMYASSFVKRWKIWRYFSIFEFLMDYATFFHRLPSRRAETAEIDAYVKDWPRISERIRRKANWTCEECGVYLKTHQRALHVHHKSGVVSDNTDANLAVLCALCHRKQPLHGRMGIPAADRDAINKLRIEQGIAPS